jgi:hypothetical protein
MTIHVSLGYSFCMTRVNTQEVLKKFLKRAQNDFDAKVKK